MGVKNTFIFFVLTQIFVSCDYLAKKCCNQGESFHVDGCVMSDHRWFYTGLEFGLPECNFTVNFAEEGSKAFCFDNSYESDSFVMINCGNDSFEIPPINYIRKCCPLNRTYDTAEQSCWGSESFEREWPNEFFNVFVAGSRGAVDINVGQQKCRENLVLVDFVVHHSRVFRDESEAIIITGTTMRFNPDEVCLDLTQVVEDVVVRACLPAETVCKPSGERICVRKCCPDGFSIKDVQCVQTNRSLPPLDINESLKPAFYFGHICSSVFNFQNSNFWLLPNGSFTNGQQIFQNYCIDSSTNHEFYYSICHSENQTFNIILDFNFLALSTSCFLLFCSITIQITQKLKNTPTNCALFYFIFLFIESSSLLLIQFEYFTTPKLCQVVVYTSKISILGAYVSLNVLVFNNWITFRKPMRKKLLPFLGFALTFLLTLFLIYLLSSQIEPYINVGFEHQFCFSAQLVHILFIFIIKFFIIISNLMMIAKTLLNCALASQKSILRGKTYQRDKEKLIFGLILTTGLAITWISELLFSTRIVSNLIFISINYIFHSLLIFVISLTGKVVKGKCNKSEKLSVISKY